MLRIDRRLIKNFDWITFGMVIIISAIGIMTIYSATRSPISEDMPSFYIKQVYWLLFSIIALLAVVSFDYIWLGRLSYIFYAVGLLLLLLVLIMGRTGMGAQRWLNLGIFSFQPSEVFKLVFLITVSRYLSQIRQDLGLLALSKIFFFIAFMPFLMVVKQPDLGTALILVFVFLALIAAKGLQRKVVVLIVLIGLISLPFLGNIFWEELKDYQKNRLIAFVQPDIDPAGIGYHINQSKVAIGSGKLLGKGYAQGTQGPFRFLPEKHTDFIFAVFAEEWGFVGSIMLLILYLAFIMRGLDTARRAKDEFGRLLATGLSFMYTIYFFINIGMTLGIMPVVGVPLPFMSYGGTALFTNFIAAGILINIRTRRFELFY